MTFEQVPVPINGLIFFFWKQKDSENFSSRKKKERPQSEPEPWPGSRGHVKNEEKLVQAAQRPRVLDVRPDRDPM